MNRLPTITIVAGGLLGLLAIFLAVRSKELYKDSLRYECADRAGNIRNAVRMSMNRALVQSADRGQERSGLVAARWHLEGGRIVARDPAGAGDPPAPILQGALADPQAPFLHLTLPAGPVAASWLADVDADADVEDADAEPASGVIVRWDLDALLRDVLGPEIGRANGSSHYVAGLLGDGVPEDLYSPAPFRDDALQRLDPPLTFWQVGVSPAAPESAKVERRLWTVLLGTVTVWLLGIVIGSVIVYVRRERDRLRRTEERNRFVKSAYHELQTPLALLRAAAESIEGGVVSDGDDLRRCVEIIQREEERLTFAVRRLLRYLRLEGEAAVPDEPAPVARELRTVVDELKPSLAAAGIEVAVSIDANLTDADQLPRELLGDAVRELLANVLKHARGATRAEVWARAAGGGRVSVGVTDDGPGVPAERLGGLFDPFVKAGGDESGSGLGLSLVREAVGRMGGRVAAGRSAEGGLAVTLLLMSNPKSPRPRGTD